MWEEISFPDTLSESRVGRQNQINASEIRPSGKYPVIDQGQDFIAGYCDDKSKLIEEDLPLVIFGDHTRCVKFVDFPFILGADGTKVLKPNPRLFDPKFYYFALLSLNIPSRGYNRHFTLLKEEKVPRPDYDEQRHIAHMLSTVQTAIEQHERLVALTREFKSALMRKLFTEGLRGDKQKETEIGLVPESWGISELGGVCSVATGTTPATGNSEYYGGDIPFIRTSEIANNRINTAEIYITPKALRDYNLKIYSKGTLFMAMYGQGKTRGQVAVLDIPATTSQNTAAITCGNMIDPEFLWHWLMSQYDSLRNTGALGHLSHLNLGYVKTYRIALPTIEEQREIARILNLLGNRIDSVEQKKAKLAQLFRTLLHQLMTGRVRVNNLDLPGLP